MSRRSVIGVVLFLVAGSLCGQDRGGDAEIGEEIHIFAAASLSDALTEIGSAYERQTGQHVVFNFGGSSTLARQIDEGAPADLFLSANEVQMDRLVSHGRIATATRVRPLSNTLVIVVPRLGGMNIAAPRDLEHVRSLALAEPSSVPAGVYARGWLVSLGLWATLQPRVVPTANVRAALAAVESGNVDAGIVYKTDALISNRVRVAYEVPREVGPEISYPFALVAGSEHPAAARRFLAYLTSPPAIAVFRRFGFAENVSFRAAGAAEQRRTARNPPHSGTPSQPHEGVLSLTLETATLSTLFILAPGLAIAWLLAKRRWRGKSLVETVVALPLVMPPVATGLILLKLLGRRGPVGGWLYRTLDLDVVFTWRAVVVAMMVMSFPLLVRAARVAFEEVEPRLEEIARTLGAREARVFATITLPLAARGIVSGMLLSFARAVGEFGATILVAGNIPGRTSTLSLSIYNDVQLGRDADAFRLLGIAVVIAFAAVWTAETFLRKRHDAHRS